MRGVLRRLTRERGPVPNGGQTTLCGPPGCLREAGGRPGESSWQLAPPGGALEPELGVGGATALHYGGLQQKAEKEQR